MLIDGSRVEFKAKVRTPAAKSRTDKVKRRVYEFLRQGASEGV